MKIAVVGGGGVGGYIAAKLGQVADVDLISNSLQKLCIKEKEKVQCYNVPILKEPPKEKIYDFVIFAVKSYTLPESIHKMSPHIDEHTIVLPLLNGIEPYEILKSHFPNTIKGAIYIISNRHGDIIELKGKGALVVMEPNEEIKELFEKAGIKVKMPDNIDKAIWQKYLFIAATAALTTKYNATFGQIASDYMEEFTKLLGDIVQIANQRGIDLENEDIQKAVELLQKSPPEAKTSMQIDFERGSQSELDNIIGYLCDESLEFAKIYKELSDRRASE